MADTFDRASQAVKRLRGWMEKNIPNCPMGVVVPTLTGAKYRIGLRPRKITPEVAEKIEEFRLLARKEGYELDVREVRAEAQGDD